MTDAALLPEKNFLGSKPTFRINNYVTLELRQLNTII